VTRTGQQRAGRAAAVRRRAAPVPRRAGRRTAARIPRRSRRSRHLGARGDLGNMRGALGTCAGGPEAEARAAVRAGAAEARPARGGAARRTERLSLFKLVWFKIDFLQKFE
jgi:hypothetical protein